MDYITLYIWSSLYEVSSQVQWSCEVSRTLAQGELFCCRRWRQHHLEKHINRRKLVARVSDNSHPFFCLSCFLDFPTWRKQEAVSQQRQKDSSVGSDHLRGVCLRTGRQPTHKEFKGKFVGQEITAGSAWLHPLMTLLNSHPSQSQTALDWKWCWNVVCYRFISAAGELSLFGRHHFALFVCLLFTSFNSFILNP